MSHTLKQHLHTKSWVHSVEGQELDDKRPLGRREQDPFDEEAGSVELQVPVPPAAVHAGRIQGGHQIVRADKAGLGVSNEAAVM